MANSPQQLLICRTVIPFKAQTQIKALGSLPLPGDVTVSGTFQNVAGRPIEANYPAPDAAVAVSLGRDLAACGSRTGAACTATALVRWSTQFMDRRTQLDLRLSKVLKVVGVNNTYGPQRRQPATQLNLEVDSILPGRLIHFGGQLTF